MGRAAALAHAGNCALALTMTENATAQTSCSKNSPHSTNLRASRSIRYLARYCWLQLRNFLAKSLAPIAARKHTHNWSQVTHPSAWPVHQSLLLPARCSRIDELHDATRLAK